MRDAQRKTQNAHNSLLRIGFLSVDLRLSGLIYVHLWIQTDFNTHAAITSR
jgi:hypothetical protein